MKKLLLAGLLVAAFQTTQAQDNLKVVDSATTFKGLTQPIDRGSLIKTSTLHYYLIDDKVVQKAGYPAQPQVIVYQDGKKYKMKIQGMEKILAVKKVEEVIESNVQNFRGYDGTTTFTLLNQQQWKQDEPTSNVFSNLLNPLATIYLTGEGYRMKIEGLKEDPILVKKVR